MLGGLFATVLVSLAVLVVVGVSSNRRNPGLTPREAAERDWFRAQVMKLTQPGKLDEATAAAVARDLEAAKVGTFLDYLDDDWAAARKLMTEDIRTRERQPDRKDWRIVNARRTLAFVDRWAELSPAQRQRLREAGRLDVLQAALRKHGKYAQGIDPCRRAVEIWGELLGQDYHYAASLNDLARLYGEMGDYARAEPMLREALLIRKNALGVDHPDYGTSLNDLAELYRAKVDHARAEPLFREALAITKKALGENDPAYAAFLYNQALLCSDVGDYKQAEPLLRQVLAIRKKAVGVDHRNDVAPLSSLGALYQAMGDYARAESMLREALAIRAKALGVDHRDDAASLNDLAELYRAIGDPALAEPLFHEALAIAKKALGENDPAYVAYLHNLAVLCSDMGNYEQAEPLLRQVLAFEKRAVGVDHRKYATPLNSLGALYQDVGDYARAEPMLRQALAIRRKALGVDHPDYAASLNNLAGLYQAMGDHARAEPMYREALVITKKARGESHAHYAQMLNNLAWLYQETRDYPQAESIHREAMAIWKKLLGADHLSYAHSLNNLGMLYYATGDLARAEPMLREALAIKEKALGVDHPDYAQGITNLALLYQTQGDSARAEILIIEALKITSNLTRGTSAVLGERQRLRMYERQRSKLDFYLSVSRSGVPKPADLYRHVLDWKGSAEARQRENRLGRDQPELAPTLEQLAQVQRQLANLAFRASAPGQGQAWRRKLDELREFKENLEADLARRSTSYRGQKQVEQLGLAEVAAALPAEVALVDFLEYTHLSTPQGGKGRFKIEQQLLAFVVRRGRPVALVHLGDARAIEESVRSCRRAIEARQGGALQRATAELGGRVWEPLRPQLGDARTVLIAPDGWLSYFPFAALPGSRPGSYLIEDLAISYVGSGRAAVEALTEPQGSSGRGLLAVGDVDFQADPGQPGPATRPPLGLSAVAQRGGFRPLPGTGPEARRARELFQAAFAGQPTELLTGAEPTEAAIKGRLDGGHWRVVHLGTHGFFETPARVAALRAQLRREDPSALALKATKQGEDDPDFALTPMLRSGVVLAGDGRDPGAGSVDASAEAPTREDGILTAEEVQGLDLRGTELMVLSACETGLGVGEYGQGVMGLQRALQGAGARAVVASLWKVDDAATSVLMEQFYTNLWVKKLPKLEALRQAQLALLNDPRLVTKRQAELANERGIGETAVKLPESGRVAAPNPRDARSDPSLWAAFVLSGDGR
jgi:CHAT domain-containing protein/Tfp pilus assembly protein PilF